jgi:hypothetical protein
MIGEVMPYIKPSKRKPFKKPIGDLMGFIENEGDLNYVISKICKRYMQMKEPTNYSLLNEIIGVLESAKLEFYRRVMVPYEDVKINEHGDI